MDDQWSFVCNGTLRGYEEFLERFVGEAVQKEQRQGTYLLRQGDPAACLYLLLSGVVENSVFLEDGRKKINMLYTGKSLLGISSMDSDVSQVNLRCLTNVRLALVHKQAVAQWKPDLLLPVALSQTYKMQGVYRQLREQSFLSTEEQVLKILKDLEDSGALEGVYPMRRVRYQMLADMLGLSRVQVSAIIGRLASQGKISPRCREALGLSGLEEKADG